MNDKCYLICGHSKDYIRYTADMLSERAAEYINISYSPEGSHFRAFGELYSFLQYKAHYVNLYEGTLIADISPWAAHEHNVLKLGEIEAKVICIFKDIVKFCLKLGNNYRIKSA